MFKLQLYYQVAKLCFCFCLVYTNYGRAYVMPKMMSNISFFGQVDVQMSYLQNHLFLCDDYCLMLSDMIYIDDLYCIL